MDEGRARLDRADIGHRSRSTIHGDTFSISALHLAIKVPYLSYSGHKNEKVTSYLLAACCVQPSSEVMPTAVSLQVELVQTGGGFQQSVAAALTAGTYKIPDGANAGSCKTSGDNPSRRAECKRVSVKDHRPTSLSAAIFCPTLDDGGVAGLIERGAVRRVRIGQPAMPAPTQHKQEITLFPRVQRWLYCFPVSSAGYIVFPCPALVILFSCAQRWTHYIVFPCPALDTGKRYNRTNKRSLSHPCSASRT
eukprot:SAG31_NODE_3270_length_4477_cov_2.498401_3_plen_250_part_00